MTSTLVCPACGTGGLGRPMLKTTQVELTVCRSCGHTVASHLEQRESDMDYHQQYATEGYTESLEGTRVRQARDMINRIAPDSTVKRHLLDFGCGRGWFLKTCAAEDAFASLAGVDTSQIAVTTALEVGASGVLLDENGVRGLRSRIPQSPEIIALLDVIEHFEGEKCRQLLEGLAKEFKPSLESFLIKVPVSTGAIYRVSLLLARLGYVKPLHTLYQVGTYPPHYHYFSHTSLQKQLEVIGLKIEHGWRDLNFEPESLGARARVRFGKTAVAWFGRVAGRVARFLGWEDSMIVIASVKN